MTALRRVKLLGIAAFTIIIIFLFYGSRTRTERRIALDEHNENRHRAKEAHKHGLDNDDLEIEKHLKSQRLKDAEHAAKAKANAKAPNPPGVWDAAVEINTILKRSPIIIFSKSYCPYSMKAKELLLETYTIKPAPYVVELDEHAHGSEIQDELEKQTGRRTVPNILVLGKSIGGSDDLAALEESGRLVSKIKGLAGKRVEMGKL
ncbi:Glutaredoxin-C8 [Dactylellina cionopaga]|nr:Glutaredoxin-C8 [Dactylellina cionopaga]